MAYTIALTPAAQKQLAALDKSVRQRVNGKLETLRADPRVGNVKRLVGTDAETWRLRVGPYRVLYTVEDARLTILVIDLGHRGEVYR